MTAKLGVSHWKKSCPSCSKRAGRLIFKDYPAEFGRSEKRASAVELNEGVNKDRRGAQSWCNECRREERAQAQA